LENAVFVKIGFFCTLNKALKEQLQLSFYIKI
jgi:hypothetical protein